MAISFLLIAAPVAACGPSADRHRLAGGKSAAASSGRASTRNTSFCRCSREKITGGVNSASRAMKLILAVRSGGQPSQLTLTV